MQPRSDVATETAAKRISADGEHGIAAVDVSDDFSREVYGVLGIPVDVIDMPMALRKIAAAATGRSPFLLSTPNLNFLVTSQHDPEFRESLLISDLCPADGMPIVWLGPAVGRSYQGADCRI